MLGVTDFLVVLVGREVRKATTTPGGGLFSSCNEFAGGSNLAALFAGWPAENLSRTRYKRPAWLVIRNRPATDQQPTSNRPATDQQPTSNPPRSDHEPRAGSDHEPQPTNNPPGSW